MNTFEVFLDIVLRFSDLKWSEFRDDLIVKCMKALRKFRDGKSLEEVSADKKISSDIEGVLELLRDFADSSSSEEVNRLVDALGMFTKAPAPCKTKMIALVETLTGKGKVKG